MNAAPLRDTAQQFVTDTETMLAAAQQGLWDAFFLAFEAREARMAILVEEAGDTLLSQLPELQQAFIQALEKNQQIEQLMLAKRHELTEVLTSFQQQQRLTMTYR